MKGGIREFGKFSEGFCFQVTTVIPDYIYQISAHEMNPRSGKTEIWLICTDDSASNSSLMHFLIKNRIKKQQNAGIHYKARNTPSSYSNVNDSQVLPGQNSKMTVSDLNKPGKKLPIDGTWIVLQDWSQCTLKCGGGKQYLHLICKPPQNGGKPCQGEAVRQRECNKHPCPILKAPGGDSQQGEKYEKPIVKVMPISNRPTRYDKCHLKEADIFAVLKPDGMNLFEEIKTNKDYINSEHAVKVPARIIMNNKSISVYKDETLQSTISSIALESCNLSRISNSNSCFFLQGKSINQQIIICSMEAKLSFVEEWDYDFHLFKHQCHEQRPIVKVDDSGLKKDFNDKIKKLKQELIEEKSLKARQLSQKDEEKSMKDQIDKTQALTMLAMQKENKLERLLEREEAMRESDEIKELEKQLLSEQRKKDVLMHSIQQKELEEQFNISRENAQLAIKKLKEEAKTAIINKRNAIKGKIAQMRLKSERRKAEIKSKILSMRSETAMKIQQYSKRGNTSMCFKPSNPPAPASPSNGIESKPYNDQLSQIEIYCNANLTNNVTKYLECKQPETFCFVCCENEFGQMHLSEREKCYNQRCNGAR